MKNVPPNAGDVGSILIHQEDPCALGQLSPCTATTELSS